MTDLHAAPGNALDPARSVSLVASAGSGKTWQLVSRILRLLLAGAEPGGILALTFTRKAAVEMHLRLFERLRRLADADDAALAKLLREVGLALTPELAARARALHARLLFAAHPPRAMTLHAFCQEVLTRFALEARVPPGFGLHENEEELSERAWRRLQSRLTANPDGAPARALARLIELGFNEITLRELADLFIQRRGEWWAYTEGQEDPAAWAAARLREQLGDCDLAAVMAEAGSAGFTARLRMLLNYLHKTNGTRSLEPGVLAAALQQTGVERFEGIETALYTKAREPYKVAANDSKLKALSAKEREHFLQTHAEVLRDFEPLRHRRHAAEAYERSAATFVLGQAVLAALAEELRREHALGFTELEWHTSRLLRRPGAADWVRYRLDARVDHLLIDEFQDTSPTQWRMLLPILEEMAAGDGGRARSLFIVGDAKQSIYGFRRANPELLNEATAWMAQSLGGTAEPLHHSRRSAPAIIDFVNALYAEELGPAIRFEAHDTHRKHDWGRVEVALPVTDDAAPGPDGPQPFRNPLEAPRLVREDRRALDEARQVAARIQALVDSGVEVTTQHGSHPIGYGDVMVLARARTQLHHLERALTAARIPFVGAARGTLLETSIARDLTALLRLLDAPHRDLELAQVLRSPLFGASDAQIAALAAEARGNAARPERSEAESKGPSTSALRAYAQGERVSTWIEALARLAPSDPLLGRAHGLLATWRELAARLPAHDLLDRIARDTDAAARYEQALPNVTGARARANLGAFLQLALEADSGRYPSLPRFLEWLAAQAKRFANAPDEPPPAAVTNVVRIMTVHAAKGLEAPAVFLVNTGNAQSPRTPRLLIEWPPDAPRPTRFMVASQAARLDRQGAALAESHKGREAREELHILYVAATRARHFLHVSGYVGPSRKNWHLYARNAMQRLPRAEPAEGTALGTLSHATGTPVRSATVPMAPAPAPADPRLRRPLQNGDAHLFSQAPSELVDEKGVRALFESAEAADRGTAIHLLLERLSQGPATDEALRAAVGARLPVEPDPDALAQWLAEARAVLAAPDLAPFFDPARYARAWNEVPVAAEGAAGAIDRLVDDGTTLWVLDYKTHARPQAAELIERYRPQLAAYASAVGAAWPGRPVRSGLVLTTTRTFVEVR
jgi:ATP-dependent helicase/nuclease subunit A